MQVLDVYPAKQKCHHHKSVCSIHFSRRILPLSSTGVAIPQDLLSSLPRVFSSLQQENLFDIPPAIVNHFGAVAKLPWLSVSLLLGAASTNLFW
jgi:hypothetical protein